MSLQQNTSNGDPIEAAFVSLVKDDEFKEGSEAKKAKLIVNTYLRVFESYKGENTGVVILLSVFRPIHAFLSHVTEYE